MENFSKNVQVRWSDLDPNFHLRHSVYYDWGAFCRIEFLNEYGLTAEVMSKLKFGPILFKRRVCFFKREIRSGDEVKIDLRLISSKKDFSRWRIQHQVVKNSDVLSAIITVDGAWISLVERKLATPPEKVHDVFNNMPKSDSFEWI